MIYVQETNAGTIVIGNTLYTVPLEPWEEVDALGKAASLTKYLQNTFI